VRTVRTYERAAMAYERTLDKACSRAIRAGIGDALRNDLAADTGDPPSLAALLAQLETRVRADVERERLFSAVDRYLEEMVRLGGSALAA
jgi:hypothetical protein